MKPLIKHQRPQIEYTLDISSSVKDLWWIQDNNLKLDGSVYELEKRISAVVGGCTLLPMRGAWADVERANLDTYEGIGFGSERGIQLQVKCELGKEERLEYAILEGLKVLNTHGFNVDWVCGKKEQVNAFNFSMKEQGI